MPEPTVPPFIPDILAVREDHQTITARKGHGGPSGCDILSVYLEGGPQYRLDQHTYEFTPPIAILIPQGTIDDDRQVGLLNGIFALFRGHGLLQKTSGEKNRFIVSIGTQKLAVPFLKQVYLSDAEDIVSMLREIANIRDIGLTGQMQRVSLLFRAIAGYCEAETRAEKRAVHREALRLRRMIEASAFENMSLENIYRELELSAAHAETLFKAAFDITPVAYRLQLRLRKSRELLVSSQMNVSQTAWAVGFTDPLYFSRVFRRAFGEAPSALICGFSGRRDLENRSL